MSVRQPTDRYLSPPEVKRFYDRLGSAQDWQGFYETPAIKELVGHSAFDTSHSVFEFGCGTGALASRLLQAQLPADARYVGVDISSTMVSLALSRLKSWSGQARVYQTDGSPAYLRRIAASIASSRPTCSIYLPPTLSSDSCQRLTECSCPEASSVW